jgi:hypothetical protein
MFAPVTYPERLESLVRMIEDTPPNQIVAAACDELGGGRSADELMLASALAAIRSSDLPSVHHGGPLHPVAGLHAIRHMAARLPGAWGALPVVQNVALSNRHIHSPDCGPFILADAEPFAVKHSVTATLEAFERSVRFGEYNACDRYFLYLLQALPPAQLLEHLLRVAAAKNTRDDHYLIYPVFTWRVVEHFGWEYARFLVRPAVRFVTRPPGPPDLEKVDALIEEHGLLGRELRTASGEDETAAIAALSDDIGRTSNLNDIPRMLARSLAEGLSLEGAGEGLSLGASRLFLRSRTRAWTEVHTNTTANVQRFLLRQPGLSARTKVRALLVWDAGPDVRLVRRQLAPDVRPDPRRVASMGFRSQESLLQEIEELIMSRHAPALHQAQGALPDSEDEIDRVVAMAQQYGDCGHDPAFLITRLGRIVCRDQSTEMHAYKHHQATCEEFYDTRPSLRWTHLLAATQGVALTRHRKEETFWDAAERLRICSIAKHRKKFPDSL